MNKKANYTGLLTQRQQVECEPLMKASSAKVKVKTGTTTSEDWVEDTPSESLKTSITTSFDE